MVHRKKTRLMISVLMIALILISFVPVNTMAENDNIKYRLVRIFSQDSQNRTVRAETLLELASPDTGSIDRERIHNIESRGVFEILNVSAECRIYIDSVRRELYDIKPETLMVITVENGAVTEMVSVDGILLQESGIYNGIIEENNPVLGYITLYFPDGSGISPGLRNALSYYRTYSYVSAYDVEVLKNGKPANIEDLNPGDSVFLKLDSEGNIVKISATDNFYPVEGKVVTKGSWMLQLKKADGSIVQYRIPFNTPVFIEQRMASWSDIKEGDEVRILLQTSGNQIIIGEISVRKPEIMVDAVYRARFSSYNQFTNSIVVSDIRQFKNGTWTNTIQGIKSFDINENYIPAIPKGMSGVPVYLAAGKSITGKDSIVWLSFAVNELRAEITGDTVVTADPGNGRLKLMNRNSTVSYDDTSIIVKQGKLLSPNQVKSRDEAYFVTGVLNDGSVKANIIWVREPLENTGLTLLRGRISQIELFGSMTLETFSEFREPGWEYYNVPKTLTIDPYVTRVFDDGGRTDLALFDDIGQNSYKKRTVYVLAQNGTAMLVSTAPFGDVVYKGRIFDLPGVQKDAFNHVVTPASSIILREGIRYNKTKSRWENIDEAEFSLMPNTVFVKNGNIIEASRLEIGDRITVIKAESGNNAFVVMVESD